jgi:RNA polymerase sigma-70 factor (ECF subfamily)
MAQTVEQALVLIRENRPESIERALALLQNTVYSLSMKVCGHPEDAEDTMQHVLMRSIPQLAQFDSPQALKVWLYKVARNHCISNHRGAQASPARNVSLDELMPDGTELMALLKSEAMDPEASLLNREVGDQLKEAVASLPEKYRMVLALHDMEELDTAEVAEVTGLRQATVRVRLHRARLMVRKYLSEKAKARGIEIHATAAPTRPARCRTLFAALSDYMDGLVDDAVCEQMDRHIGDCKPCQAFLRSLKSTVQRCRSYTPECKSSRAEELRRQLVGEYQAAVAELARRQRAGNDIVTRWPSS